MNDYTLSRASIDLGVTEKTLRRWVEDGLVPYLRLPNGRIRFTPELVAQIKASWLREPVAVRVIPERLEDDSPGCTCYSYAEGGPHDPFCALEA